MTKRSNTRIAIEHGWEVAVGAEPTRWFPAKVPGTLAGALRAAGEWTWDEQRDFDSEDVWFRAPLGGELGAGCVLGFDGIATLWEAWVDGVLVASADSMWARREVVLEHPAKQLLIKCRALAPELAKKKPRPRWKVPMLEQQQLRWIRTTLLGRTPGWSPPCPPIGPWRPIWIEERTHGEIEVEANVVGGDGEVSIAADLVDADVASVVVTRGDQRLIAPLVHTDGRWRGTLRVPDCALWWPHTHGEPARYAVHVDVVAKDRAFEVDLGHVGFRTIFVDQTDGDFNVHVNGIPIFCRGACWTPLDVVTLQSGEYDTAIQQMRDAGMNMLRVGGTMTYEHDALYDALDAHGVLLWQDLMFANMDYPDELDIRDEVTAELARLRHRPCLAVICGNSEAEQQAAMWGAGRERWSPKLFHEVIPELVASLGVAYVPSSATGGAYPHANNRGPSSYYGVGAYSRPLDDARRAEVVFASECLGFANIPDPSGLPELSRESVERWKARVPRDRTATWDFDDVRDHYVTLLFGPDVVAQRTTGGYDRYLDVGRVTTGEVMAQTFAEWRRARSKTRGGLVWTLRDLWPGAGWGVIDANGRPKLAWYALRRALAPTAIAFSDEGTNGLALHAHNETARAITGVVQIDLWRDSVRVGGGSRELVVDARSSAEVAPTDLLEGWSDLSYAYRFGPPTATVIHARWHDREAFWFPAGFAHPIEDDVGLAARRDGASLIVSTQRFAQSVMISLPGCEDNGFHLAPGQTRTIACSVGTGTVRALNSVAVVTI